MLQTSDLASDSQTVGPYLRMPLGGSTMVPRTLSRSVRPIVSLLFLTPIGQPNGLQIRVGRHFGARAIGPKNPMMRAIREPLEEMNAMSIPSGSAVPSACTTCHANLATPW